MSHAIIRNVTGLEEERRLWARGLFLFLLKGGYDREHCTPGRIINSPSYKNTIAIGKLKSKG